MNQSTHPTLRWPLTFYQADMLAALAILAAAIGILWRPIVLGEVFLPLDLIAHLPPWRFSYERTQYINPIVSDLVQEYYPRRLLASQMLRQGQLPLWNPNILGGMPLMADSYSALFYPLSVLFVLLPVQVAWGWYALLHLMIAGGGTWLLARAIGQGRIAALVSALTYMGCGFTMMWLGFPEFIAIVAWLPVALWCIERYESATQQSFRAQLGWLIGLALILACFVLCHLQLAFYAGASVACYWLVRRLCSASQRTLGALAALAAVAASALALSAIQWLPTFELASLSQRIGSVDRVKGSLGPIDLLRFVAPTVAGMQRFSPGWGPPTVSTMFPYIGLLPLLLACIGILSARTPATVSLTLLAVIATTLAALPAEVLAAIPLLNQLPAVNRWTMVGSLALALLAGSGFQWLLDSATDRGALARPIQIARYGALAVSGTALLVALAYLWRADAAASEGGYLALIRRDMPVFAQLLRGAALLLVVLAVATWRSARSVRFQQRRALLLSGAALALIVLDLGWYGTSIQSSATPKNLFQPTPDLVAAVGNGTQQQTLNGDMLYPPTRTSDFLARETGVYRVFAGDHPALQSNTFSVFGVQDVRGYASLFSASYWQFTRRWQNDASDAAGWADVYIPQAYQSQHLLDLMNVRYIVFNPQSKNEARYKGLELVERNDEGAIYRNPRALPRAFLVHQAEQLADDRAVLDRLTEPGFPVGEIALLTTPPPVLAPPAAAEPGPTITRYTPLEVVIEAVPSAPALLVLSDTYYPGWEATIDGQPAPILVTNTVLRGVALPVGRHEVVFRYRPRPFYIGAAISMCSLLLLVGIAAWRWRVRESGQSVIGG